MGKIADARSVYAYDVIGSMDLPAVSQGPDGMLYYWGLPEKLFHGFEAGSNLPSIVPGLSAIAVTLRTMTGNPVRAFTALITSVSVYRYQGNQLELQARYTEIPTEAVATEVQVLEPQPEMLLQDGPHLGILYRGDAEHIIAFANRRLRLFQHGEKIYHTNRLSRVTRKLAEVPAADEKDYVVGVIVLAAVDPMPEPVAFYDFYVHYCNFIGIPAESYEDFMAGAYT